MARFSAREHTFLERFGISAYDLCSNESQRDLAKPG